MEPERKIEKWLRAYAKTRRRQVQEPMKMPPAMRRLLQSEIARTLQRQKDHLESGAFSLLEILRKQWAFLLACTLGIFLITTAFFASLTPAKKKAQAMSAMNNLTQLGTDLGKSAADNRGELPEPLDELKSRNLQSEEVTNGLTLALSAPTVTPPPEGTPAVNETVFATARRESVMRLDQSVKLQPSYYGPRNAFQNTAGTPPILANFVVQQNGNAIRVLDQDGSVYDGTLELAKPATINESPASPPLNGFIQNSAGDATGLSNQSLPIAKDSLRLAQNYFFRVYGTNQTLKQPVVFTGNLLVNADAATRMTSTFSPNSLTESGSGFGGGGGGFSSAAQKTETTNQLVQFLWSSLRIDGTATVNLTNQIPINAAPVPPAKN